jgi:hypothetical protein
MDQAMRSALGIIFAEFEGAKYNWDLMKFEKPRIK